MKVVPLSLSMRKRVTNTIWFREYRSGLSELIHVMTNKEKIRVVPLSFSIRKRSTDTTGSGLYIFQSVTHQTTNSLPSKGHQNRVFKPSTFPASRISGIPVDSEYSYACPVFLWLPRLVFPGSKLPGIPIDSEIFLGLSSIPMAAQMGIPRIQATRYSYRFRSVPMAA